MMCFHASVCAIVAHSAVLLQTVWVMAVLFCQDESVEPPFPLV